MCPDGEKDTRVTLYNPQERRKLSGNAAPFKRNLEAYLAMHPDWELYTGQDGGGSRKKRQRTADPKRKVEAVKRCRVEAQKPAPIETRPIVSDSEYADDSESDPESPRHVEIIESVIIKPKKAQKVDASQRESAEPLNPMSSLLWAIGQTTAH